MTDLERNTLGFISKKLEKPDAAAIKEVQKAFGFYLHLVWRKVSPIAQAEGNA